MPDFKDPDGDQVASINVNFGLATQFATGNYPDLSFSPSSSEQGFYLIEIIATDNNPDPLQSLNKFTLIVGSEVLALTK